MTEQARALDLHVRRFRGVDRAGIAARHAPVGADLVALLDEAFLASFPGARRVLELLEERGWTGWTAIRRTQPVARVSVVSGRLPG